jgi:hypothetical protein
MARTKKTQNAPKIIIRVDDEEARQMLGELAVEDRRPWGGMVSWLIRQEFARRRSTPQPVITVADAQNNAQAAINL